MGQKVLVFESDAAFAGELRDGLTKLGFAVLVVDDGSAGLQQASSARPDLILLSIELPRMNGFSVCNKLKKDPTLRDVPLIIMSSESSEETFEQHRKLRTRAEDYVHKPIAFGELLARIQTFVAVGGDSAGAGHAAEAPAERSAESLDGDELIIEEMPSRPPVGRTASPESEQTNGNGHASIERVLRAASDRPAARIDAAPRAPATAPATVSAAEDPRLEAMSHDLASAEARIRGLEQDLEAANEQSARARAGAPDAGELEQLRKDNEDLKARLASASSGRTGGVSSREFLDLREALNKKDKELLSLKEALSKKDKEIVDVREKSLAFERAKSELDDKVLEQERELAERQDKIEALQADKDQAKKAGEDFKRRAERAAHETDATKKALAELDEKRAAEVAAKEAEVAALREEHAQNLAAERGATATALEDAEEQKKRELHAANAAAQQDKAEAIAARERELQGEHESKVAALLRASERDKAQLASAHEQALADQKQALDAARDARVAELEASAAWDIGVAEKRAEARVAAAEREGAEQLAAAKATAEARVAEAERERVEEVAAARAMAEARVASAEREGAEQLAAAKATAEARVAEVERESAEQLASVRATAEARVAEVERESAEKVASAEAGALEKIAGVEAQAASAKVVSDAQVAGLEDDLSGIRSRLASVEANAAELTAQLAATTEAKSGLARELDSTKQRIAMLEADLAATRHTLDETKGHLVTQTNRLDRASAKIDADKGSLDRAKDALAVALGQIEEAEGRAG